MTDLVKYLEARMRIFANSLSEKDLEILETIPEDQLHKRLDLLFTRRAGEGELDIFCGYYENGSEVKAVYLSLHPAMPVILFNHDEVMERVLNLKRQNLQCDQSEQALSGWPS